MKIKHVKPSALYKYCPYCSSLLLLKTKNKEQVKFCQNCKSIFWDNPKPVVSILIAKDNKILMTQRAKEPLKDYWCLPGGFIKYTERPEEALIRETKEEIGIEPKITRLIGNYQIDNDPRGVHIDLIYEGLIESDIVKLSREHKSFSFFLIKNLPDKIAYKHREAIGDWVKSSQTPSFH